MQCPCDADKMKKKEQETPFRRNYLWSPNDVKMLPQEMKTITALNLCVPKSKGHTQHGPEGQETASTRSSIKECKEPKDKHPAKLAGPGELKAEFQHSLALIAQRTGKMGPEQNVAKDKMNSRNTGTDTMSIKDCPANASGSSAAGYAPTHQGADSHWAGVAYERNHLERFFSNQLAIGCKK
jgi:hypothetical protein